MIDEARRRAAIRPQLVVAERSNIPLRPVMACEALESDGRRCGRAAIGDDPCLCLGHKWEACRGQRLRPAAARVTSKTVLKAELQERFAKLKSPTTGRNVLPGGMGIQQQLVSKALSVEHESAFATLARRMGYERLDDDTYRQRRAG